MQLKQLLLGILALALIGGLGALWLAPAGIARVPDITVTTLQGDKLSLMELRGQPLLVTFWASTCSSCIREMPHLISLYNELAPGGLEVIGIAMAYDPPNRVIEISKAKQIPYPLALDINSAAAKAFGDVSVTPSTFLIAPDGQVVLQQSGALNTQKIRGLVLDMLARMSHQSARISRSRFVFTRDFLTERNTSVYFRGKKISCGNKDQARSCRSGETCGLTRST